MSTGVIKAVQPKLQYTDVTIPSVTLNSDGYATVTSYCPVSLDKLMFVMVQSWTSSTKHTAFTVTARGVYVIGTAGDVITGLVLRYFYAD